MIIKIIVFIFGTVAGIGIIRYVGWIYKNVSTLPWFDKVLGYGGGYTGWRIFGVAVIIVSWVAAFKLL